jgi:hypothetical protein
MFMDMLRTRGFRWPFTTMKEWSDGHLKMPADFPA